MIKWKGTAWSFHPLFVIVMLGSVVTGYFVELFTLFVIVLVHELGHVFVAKSFGWTVREVKLLPFGGVAEVEEAGGVPAKEDALVAIAGPLQNVWMGLAAWACGKLGFWDPEWAAYVWQANVMIGLFNLLPIHPLDGGKLLQAALSYAFNYYKVLIWTARISLLFSVLMIAGALLPYLTGREGIQLNLLIVGVFLLLTNWTYYRNVPFLFYRFLMHRGRIAMKALALGQTASPLIVSGRQSIISVARLFSRERYHLIYMVEPGSKEVKVVPEQRIVEGCLSERNPARAVSELFS
ncbi:M50 family metallopeptidase [Paenibacillus arenilitoris]|uniref:M50 family metallopeptidase n=1 Tax=Paenibacillus arenilitoris TaxID=2772299 RepID=A0A927CRS5_9BACL|nr:M50 family metallopeptidase [Paenibacillus arenilitoris]MBD2870445.1 M50 family metallopeptidase [Paenibacillus arenilitoris]